MTIVASRGATFAVAAAYHPQPFFYGAEELRQMKPDPLRVLGTAPVDGGASESANPVLGDLAVPGQR